MFDFFDCFDDLFLRVVIPANAGISLYLLLFFAKGAACRLALPFTVFRLPSQGVGVCFFPFNHLTDASIASHHH